MSKVQTFIKKNSKEEKLYQQSLTKCIINFYHKFIIAKPETELKVLIFFLITDSYS